MKKSRSDSHFDNTPNKVNLWTGCVDEIFYNEKQTKNSDTLLSYIVINNNYYSISARWI